MLYFFSFLFSLPLIPPLADINNLFSFPWYHFDRVLPKWLPSVSRPSHLSCMDSDLWREVRFIEMEEKREKNQKAVGSLTSKLSMVLMIFLEVQVSAGHSLIPCIPRNWLRAGFSFYLCLKQKSSALLH